MHTMPASRRNSQGAAVTLSAPARAELSVARAPCDGMAVEQPPSRSGNSLSGTYKDAALHLAGASVTGRFQHRETD